jgi:two-component system chemotaxis response regulator CheB
VDYVTKPGGTISLTIDEIRVELVRKIRSAARSKIKGNKVKGLAQRIREDREKPVQKPVAFRRGIGGDGLVIIGVSTGGPRTLEDILPLLDADFPWPILVAQHMPPAFTKPFAMRMNDMCPLNIQEASQLMPLEPGNVYIGKGGADMVVGQRNGKLTVIAKPESREFLWHPSVELMGISVLEHCDPARVIGVMLTGMGYDGAESFAEIKRRGGRTIAESEASAVVFGMPAELIKKGGASIVLPSDKIAAQINTWVRR